MSDKLSSPTINKAIGKLVRRHGAASLWDEFAVEQEVVKLLDCLGYLGVLDYSRFNPDLLEQSLNIGNFTLEVETISKDEN